MLLITSIEISIKMGAKLMQTANSVGVVGRHEVRANAPLMHAGKKRIVAAPAGSIAGISTTVLGGSIPTRPVFVSAAEIQIRKAEVNKASASISIAQEDRSEQHQEYARQQAAAFPGE